MYRYKKKKKRERLFPKPNFRLVEPLGERAAHVCLDRLSVFGHLRD
jgi:hypothetical protein